MPDVHESAELTQLIESARRLGVEIDEAESLKWLSAMAAKTEGDDVVVDKVSGTFGHRTSMLDFSPRDLERFRKIGEVVEVTGEGGESALALSGSAAQSKIQSFPGDADFFQRINIKAATREEACGIMARLMRDHVLSHLSGPTFQFLEAKLGSYPEDGFVRGEAVRKGSPVTWKAPEIEAGEQILDSEDGTQTVLRWDEVALDPGWCKLDWVVDRPGAASASRTPATSSTSPGRRPTARSSRSTATSTRTSRRCTSTPTQVPTFAKVAKFVSDDALDEYVDRLEEEVHKYLTKHLNYGKAAKRMYNVFRLSGRHMDAAFVRELFDEPATILYQVWSLISTLENATKPGSSIPIADVQAQADALVLEVVKALDGDAEAELVQVAAGAAADPRGPELRRGALGRGGCGADPGGQPDQHVLPRPARGHADDQGVHHQDAGRTRRALTASSRSRCGWCRPRHPGRRRRASGPSGRTSCRDARCRGGRDRRVRRRRGARTAGTRADRRGRRCGRRAPGRGGRRRVTRSSGIGKPASNETSRRPASRSASPGSGHETTRAQTLSAARNVGASRTPVALGVPLP